MSTWEFHGIDIKLQRVQLSKDPSQYHKKAFSKDFQCLLKLIEYLVVS